MLVTWPCPTVETQCSQATTGMAWHSIAQHLQHRALKYLARSKQHAGAPHCIRLLIGEHTHLNIKLSRGRSLEVWVARVLVRRMHYEDQGQLWPRHASAKEAGEGNSVGVDAGRLHWGIPHCLPCAALPHYHNAHHLVPPAAVSCRAFWCW